MNTGFTYCWTDHKTNKLYIGVHKGLPTDGYIASGKLFLSEYNRRTSDFTREILAVGNYDDMIKFETTILKSVNAAKSPFFYNGHNGDGKFYNKGHTDETKEKLKAARNKRTDKPRLGKPLSETGKLKASVSAKLRVNTQEGKNNLSDAGKKSAEVLRNRLATDPEFAAAYKKRCELAWVKRRNKEK